LSVCEDGTMHLWNLRQKVPAVLQSLKFNRERYLNISKVFSILWVFTYMSGG